MASTSTVRRHFEAGATSFSRKPMRRNRSHKRMNQVYPSRPARDPKDANICISSTLLSHDGHLAHPMSPDLPLVAPEHYDSSNCVAMDCEMVGVGPSGLLSVLARVTVVDWHGSVLLDTFVKVQERVVDYRTHVSGIRPGDLTSDKALEFGTVRDQVQNLLKGKVLVGHGLANDLKVFHLKHPWYMIRDSAAYQPLLRFNTQPRRLKDLANAELGLQIQRDGVAHDSIEDARAALEIYKRHQAGWDYDVRAMMSSTGTPTK